MEHLDPSMDVIHAIYEKYNTLSWSPALNSVPEESVYDIQYTNDILHYLPTNSRKTRQYRERKERQHHSKISASINQIMNGIYKAKIIPSQQDNGANRTCTSNKQLLANF